MKKKLLLFIAVLFIALTGFGQAPGIFNYQGVARNSVGNVLQNKSISLRLSIHDGTAAGPTVYSETRTVVTNPFGLFNVQVGSPGASAVVGTILGVNWAVGNKYIQVEIDPNGGSTFTNIGTAQLASVPYAINAASSGDLVLPFTKSQANASILFNITNTGTGGAGSFAVNNAANTTSALVGTTNGTGNGVLGAHTATTGTAAGVRGETNSTDGNAMGVQGVVTPVGPGGFSAGVRGVNNGTGGLGIGVYGSQAGSGWGVYGTTPSGIGVHGNSTNGFGMYGLSSNGIGVYGLSTNAQAGVFEIVNNANASNALSASTNGTGWAANFTNTNAVPRALRTVGAIQHTGIGEAAGRVLTTDASGNATWQVPGAAADLTLPFDKTQAEVGFLFRLTNSGTTSTSSAIEGVTNSDASSVYAIRGLVTPTSSGGFSSAVRGVNNGTGGLGIGIWGSQAGSGWGVYGVTPDGLGVYGNASAGGTGVYANSNTGTGLQATSNNGIGASFNIFNNANNNNVVNASSLGNGTVISVTTSGSGAGVRSSTGSGFALHGITSAQSSAGVVGDNNGAGEAVVGRTNSDIAGAVVGRNDGGGYGVRGFVATNNSGNAVGVFGQIGLAGSTGRAGRFENLNATNTQGNTFEVETNGNGNIPDNTQGNAGSFLVDNTNSVAAGVRSEVKTIFGNFGAAGLFGVSSGTGGFGGLIYSSNNAGNGPALVALTDGNGNAITANAGNNGNGVETNIDGSGNALYAWVPTFATGRAGRFNNFNDANNSDVITVTTVGNGIGGNFKVDNNNGTSPAVRGEVNSIFANFGTAGIYGISSGTGGFAGLFHASNPAGNGPALIAIADGNGNGITANASNGGDGVETTADGTGNALYAWTPNFSNGRAARLVNYNDANVNPVLTVEQHSAGAIALFKSGDPGTVNVARISATGQIFANGGFTVGGADVAEYFEAEGNRNAYEPGDVLVISQSSDRKVEKSSAPYSTLVSGVYATKPGVALTERKVADETDDLSDMVPMGVIGVIPTKVCMEGGAIKRGDLIVTSSISGVAMKADPDKVKVGQVLGKALQDYNGTGVGKINVLVSVK